MLKRRPELKLVAVPQVIAGRMPAHNLDAEAAVLSAILLDRKALARVVDVIAPIDMYSDANRVIFDAALELDRAGTPIDIVTVASWLRDRERLAQVGGAAYLAQLADATPAIAHVEQHAAIVAEKSRIRQRVALCQMIAAEGYGDVGTETEWAEDCDRRWQNLPGGSAKSTSGTLSDGLREAFSMLHTASRKRGQVIGHPMLIAELDRITGGINGPAVTLIGASTGGGKSALLGNVAVNIASTPAVEEWDGSPLHVAALRAQLRPGEAFPREPPREIFVWRGVAIFSLEMKRAEFAMRMACSQGRVDSMRIKNGEWDEDDLRRLTAAAAWLDSLPIEIDDDVALTVMRLSAKVRRVEEDFAARGIRLVLVGVDYVQLVNGRDDVEPGANRERELAEIGRRLKILAGSPSRFGSRIAYWILTQLNDDDRARESKALEMHADDFWIVSRERESQAQRYDGPAKTRRAKITIKKQRGGGRDLIAETWFHEAYTLFSDDERLSSIQDVQ